MRPRKSIERRCTYFVVLGPQERSFDELRELASYLSILGVGGCEVIVVDPASPEVFHRHRRVLRWVSRHVTARPRHRTLAGTIDPVRAAMDLAACEKVIVAGVDVRYTELELDGLCRLLDVHEVVEPQDYFDPLPWWGGIETGRMLVHRGIVEYPDHGSTFGFRRSALRGLRSLDLLIEASDDHVRRLAAQGAEVFSAPEVFVQRKPPELQEWIRQRPLQADDDFALPVKTAFFFALIPMALMLAAVGGLRLAGGYAGAIAFASVSLAVRGRIGAGAFFPLRACLFAPVWVFERSVSVYWALLRKLRRTLPDPSGEPVVDRKVASGE